MSFINRLFKQVKPSANKYRNQFKNNNKSSRQYSQQPNRGVPSGNKKEFYYLYVLKLSNGGFYVGITNNPERRFSEHSSGQGSKVTHTYPPVGVISCEPLGVMTYAKAEKFEDDKTLTLMEINGYSSVRGGHWCMVNDKAIYLALVNNKDRILRDFGRQVERMVYPR